MTRTGAEYLESLKDGRHIVIDGERVTDIASHPAFERSVQAFARLYDLTHESPSNQEEQFIHAGITGETDNGFKVQGAKMIGTAAIFSNLIFVSCIQPLTPDDADYAFSFAIPIDTPGLKFYSRRSYEQAATSVYDYPLSSRFDENDCLVVFDDGATPSRPVTVCASG